MADFIGGPAMSPDYGVGAPGRGLGPAELAQLGLHAFQPPKPMQAPDMRFQGIQAPSMGMSAPQMGQMQAPQSQPFGQAASAFGGMLGGMGPLFAGSGQNDNRPMLGPNGEDPRVVAGSGGLLGPI